MKKISSACDEKVETIESLQAKHLHDCKVLRQIHCVNTVWRQNKTHAHVRQEVPSRLQSCRRWCWRRRVVWGASDTEWSCPCVRRPPRSTAVASSLLKTNNINSSTCNEVLWQEERRVTVQVGHNDFVVVRSCQQVVSVHAETHAPDVTGVRSERLHSSLTADIPQHDVGVLVTRCK